MAQQSIEHIVLYSFHEHEALSTAVQYIKNLATTAKRNGEPYIRSVKCGTTRPAENVRSLGFNLASILVFESDEDRRYFVKEEPSSPGVGGIHQRQIVQGYSGLGLR
ncbi:unnamed protein product [Clonostachys rosea]|uniref:Stress-response A/B barrel domain-containing protein n=1 Tax=Bionectria ochroleuca TaxID=29856 RepID=A0ABY6TU88_BIOOC|nr:unnamed protein product [Clonostachys rosea]